MNGWMDDAYNILPGEIQGKGAPGKSGCRYENNIKI
jgi:hypothetical protein